MKVGIIFANTGPFGTAQGCETLAKHAEAAGFDSLWTVEHIIFPEGYESVYPYDQSGRMPMRASTPLADPLIWLTWVAAHTSHIRLATGILILPERNPVVLAKELATLDTMSNGRVDLGIGVGWLREEFDAVGIPWERRGDRTDEYIEAMRTLWDVDHASFRGDFVSFDQVSSNPKPVAGQIPVFVGGHSDAAARRAGRLGEGFFPAQGDLDHLIRVMRRSAEEIDRNPDEIEIVWGGEETIDRSTVDKAASLAAKGVTRLVVPGYLFWNDPEDSLERFGEEVVTPLAEL